MVRTVASFRYGRSNVAATDTGARLRSRDILKVFSARTVWRLLRGMARAPFDPKYAGSPLAVCWFVNFDCNARCVFCCKADEIRKGPGEFPALDADAAAGLLERIRRSVEMLYLSGGEPLLHPILPEILREARRLRFKSVGLSSNALLLDRRAEVLDFVDVFSVSLHGVNPATHAQVMGISEEWGRKAFDNLALLQDQRRRSGMKVIVNFVIHPSNLHQALDMIEFARERDFMVELVPANEHGGPPRQLVEDPRYTELLGRVIELRKSGRAPHLAGSTAYYRRIRSFQPFRCFPYGVPNITPDGRLCTPCDAAEQYAVSVMDHPSLKAAVRASRPHLGAYPCAKGRCFKAGIIERSRFFGILADARWHE